MNAEWKSEGKIEVKDGMVMLPPNLPTEPGVYKLLFDSVTVYLGEANDIQRRLGDYVKYYPSVGIESELRVHQALLKNERGAEVWTLTGHEFSTHSARCIREHAEIHLAKKTPGMCVLNGGVLEDRIAFHEGEAKRLRAKLALQIQTNGAGHE